VPGGGGVDIGPVTVRLSVAPMQGMCKDPRTGQRIKAFKPMFISRSSFLIICFPL